MFGEVVGVDRDVGVNAITYYHIIGDSKSFTNTVATVRKMAKASCAYNV